MLNQILNKLDKGENLTAEEQKVLYVAMSKTDRQGEELRRDFAESRARVLAPVIRQQSLIRQIYTETETNGVNIPYPVRGEKVKYAWYMSSLSGTPQRSMEEDEIYIPTFFIKAGARWKLDILKAANTRIIQNQEEDAKDSIVYQENLAGWKLIQAAETAAAILAVPHLASDGDRFSLEVMIEILTAMDERDDKRMITDIYLSPRRYYELLKWAKLDTEELDDGTRREIFVGGPDRISRMLSSWKVAFHKVDNPEFVDDRKLYAFDRRTFGAMQVDIPWETLNDNLALQTWEFGWIGRQKVGFAILDAYAACTYSFV